MAFRVWHEATSDWMTVDFTNEELLSVHNGSPIVNGYFSMKHLCAPCMSAETFKRSKKWQFTGQYDREGRRIWEGDVVERDGRRRLVRWDDYNTGFLNIGERFTEYPKEGERDVLVVGDIKDRNRYKS